jgi:hypothetical protein
MEDGKILLGPIQDLWGPSPPRSLHCDQSLPLLLGGSSWPQNKGFLIEPSLELEDCLVLPVASWLEGSTALGKESLETPAGMRSLKAKALLFLKIHKGALSSDLGSSASCSGEQPGPQHPQHLVPVFLYNVCVYATLVICFSVP